jgi:anti-sigma factor RsiW
MTCAELEILLCDYVDGTLHAEERTALEAHLSECPACTELAADIQGVTAFIGRVPEAQPPAELMTRILHYAPTGRKAAAEERSGATPSWGKRFFGGFTQAVWQPRYVMGMAMTILSFSMLARFAHIEPRQLRPADLDPVKVWQSVDDRSHRIWDRSMKYYDNLKLVIEIQSRLKEWTDQDPGAPGGAVRTSAQPGARERGSQQ